MKKILSLALCALILVSLLASWSKVDNGSKAENAANNTSSENASEIDEYISYLAEKNNFSGKTFTWIGGGSQAPTADEESGDILSDALYYRQRDIESYFNITWSNYSPEQIEGSGSHPVVDAVVKDVMAGTGAYDAGLSPG